MRALVIKESLGTPDNDATARYFPVGEVIYGDLAETAVRDGWAEEDAGGAKAEKPAAPKAAAKARGKKA